MIIYQITVMKDLSLKNCSRSSYLIVKIFRFGVNAYVEATDLLV